MKIQPWEVPVLQMICNYYYNQILIRDDKTIPASLTRNINSAGGQYEYQKKELEWEVLVFKVSDESILI
jgi:hypothetical protein